jgi:hypothetical protein
MKEIQLTKGYVALVDDEDAEWLSKHRWHVCPDVRSKSVRAMSVVGGKNTFMHRLILNPPAKLEIDHINGNPLDNRRSNLRIVTHQQNIWNRKLPTPFGFTGVWRQRNSAYYAAIRVGGKRKILGTFPTAEDAALAFNDAALAFRGEYQLLNEVHLDLSSRIPGSGVPLRVHTPSRWPKSLGHTQKDGWAKTGTKGLYVYPRGNQFLLVVRQGEKPLRIGCFKTRDEAVDAGRAILGGNTIKG